MYSDIVAEERWPNPTLSSAADVVSTLSGPSGVKMSGPYSWVPPNYWLTDAGKFGGAWGFLTEGGPGEAPMTLSSWQRTTNDTWPLTEPTWSFHCGNPKGVFHDLRFFTPPLEARYGAVTSVSDYLLKAQAMAFEGTRAMYESYTRNKHLGATGVVQWMLNNAFPSHIWHLYDFYLVGGGGFYGARQALEDLHVMMSYSDGSVWVYNNRFTSREQNLTVVAQLVNFDGTVGWSATETITGLGPDVSIELPQLRLNPFPVVAPSFLRLQWGGQDGDNWYWLSPNMDVIDWKETNFYQTNCSSFADFTALTKSLAPATVSMESVLWTEYRGGQEVNVTLITPSSNQAVAFFISVELDGGQAEPPVVVLWSSNYITMRPGERRVLTGKVLSTNFQARGPSSNLSIRWWNMNR